MWELWLWIQFSCLTRAALTNKHITRTVLTGRQGPRLRRGPKRHAAKIMSIRPFLCYIYLQKLPKSLSSDAYFRAQISPISVFALFVGPGLRPLRRSPRLFGWGGGALGASHLSLPRGAPALQSACIGPTRRLIRPVFDALSSGNDRISPETRVSASTLGYILAADGIFV